MTVGYALQARYLLAPPWVRLALDTVGLVVGAAVAVALVVATDGSPSHPSPWIFVLGPVLGGTAGRAWRVRGEPRRPAWLEPLRALPPSQRTAALRAVRRGPRPADPATRAAALAVAQHRLAEHDAGVGTAVLVLALVLLGTALLAVSVVVGSLVILAFALVGVRLWWDRRSLDRRVSLLA